MMWKRIFGRDDREQEAYAIYAGLVSQARLPVHYLDGEIPDTLEGRFEMVALHAFLVLRRLRKVSESEAPAAKALSQKVFDILFDDMDQTLREIGISDLKVGKEIKALAAAFYGRIGAYDEGLDSPDNEKLKAALLRNIFPETVPTDSALNRLATYARQLDGLLAETDVAILLQGKFPNVTNQGVV